MHMAKKTNNPKYLSPQIDSFTSTLYKFKWLAVDIKNTLIMNAMVDCPPCLLHATAAEGISDC